MSNVEKYISNISTQQSKVKAVTKMKDLTYNLEIILTWKKHVHESRYKRTGLHSFMPQRETAPCACKLLVEAVLVISPRLEKATFSFRSMTVHKLKNDCRFGHIIE